MRLTIKNEYPPEWPLVSHAVKVAADWRCIRCGHSQHAESGRSGACDAACTHAGIGDGKLRYLTVHHLDGDKANLSWWNLLALCQACHLSVQARVIPARAWLWEHSAWFRPYVAGYYASTVGVSLSRDAVEAELEHWLEVGQPWRSTCPIVAPSSQGSPA